MVLSFGGLVAAGMASPALALFGVVAWCVPSHGSWVISLQCSSSPTLDCTQPIDGALTIAGSQVTALDSAVDSVLFTGDPGGKLVDAGTGTGEGSFSSVTPLAAAAASPAAA